MKSPACAPDEEPPSTEVRVDFDLGRLPFGLWQGDGVFETIRVVEGVPRELEAHLTRCLGACAALGLETTCAELEAVVADTIRQSAAMPEAVLRVVVASVEVGRSRGHVVASLAPLPASMAVRRRGLEVRTLAAACTPWSALKVTSALGHRWAQRRTHPQEPLYVDEASHVLEGASWNVFARFDSTLVTPPCDGRILPGTSRARLLRCAEALGCTPLERPLGLGELARAKGVFATSALLPIAPIVRLDGLGLAQEEAWTARAREYMDEGADAAD
jgi:branched-subunit amino acid aminotransferase/4-amino-4-deoxychorismate lyase